MAGAQEYSSRLVSWLDDFQAKDRIFYTPSTCCPQSPIGEADESDNFTSPTELPPIPAFPLVDMVGSSAEGVKLDKKG
eukprot:11607518-Prorocentrum_lima.AAC.1